MSLPSTVLVANRGEIAVRVLRTPCAARVVTAALNVPVTRTPGGVLRI